ncbi:uncharacterized protein LOC142321406 isoform X2 [Lycorma delicatula]|uniref:uncharacterized protein LOC142321406 isoform X2 n=1 Tax=Lycorma delicatula TaxID=130591 RepID=UPI003F50E471
MEHTESVVIHHLKKLFELQSRFGNDSRFYTDEKFYESDEEKNDNEKQDIERLEDFDEKEETINDEVKKQLKILQSIVGTEFSGQQKKQKLKHVTSATGVRYDPSVPEHEKFIVKPSSIDENEDVKQKKVKNQKTSRKKR